MTVRYVPLDSMYASLSRASFQNLLDHLDYLAFPLSAQKFSHLMFNLTGFSTRPGLGHSLTVR